MATTQPPADPSPQTLLATAREFLQGAQVLVANGETTRAAAFLAGFALELALKAYLLHTGAKSMEELKKIGHNLRKLWTGAARIQGSPFTIPIPTWAVSLFNSHRKLFYRYQSADLHGYVVPQLEELARVIQVVGGVVPSTLIGALAKAGFDLRGSGTYIDPEPSA